MEKVILDDFEAHFTHTEMLHRGTAGYTSIPHDSWVLHPSL